MAAARHNPARQQWRSFPRETDDPLRIGTDIRPAETRIRHAGDDRFGKGHPLREILVEVPVLRPQPVVGVAVKFRFIADLKKEQPFAQLPGDISRLFGIPFRRARPEIQAINRVPPVAFKNPARRSTATGSIAVNECGIQLSAR